MCLKIGVLTEGIYLFNLLNIFAPFNQPLLIPWSDITEVLIKNKNFGFKEEKTYIIKIQNTDITTQLVLPAITLKDAEKILQTKIKLF